MKWHKGHPEIDENYRRSEDVLVRTVHNYIAEAVYRTAPELVNEKISHWSFTDDGDGRINPRIPDEEVLGFIYYH